MLRAKDKANWLYGTTSKLAYCIWVIEGLTAGRTKAQNRKRHIVVLGGKGGDIKQARKAGYPDCNIHVAETDRKAWRRLRREFPGVDIRFGCVSILCCSLSRQGIKADVSLDFCSCFCRPFFVVIRAVVTCGILCAGNRLHVTWQAKQDKAPYAVEFLETCYGTPMGNLETWRKRARHWLLSRKLSDFGFDVNGNPLGFKSISRYDYLNGHSCPMSAAIFEVS